MKNFLILLALTACGLPALQTDTSGLGESLIGNWIRQDFNILIAGTHKADDVGDKFKKKLSAYCQAEYADKSLGDCLAATGMYCDEGICRYRGSAILTSTANGKVHRIDQKNYSLLIDTNKGISHLICRVEVDILPVTDE